jgi:hypothetical protein
MSLRSSCMSPCRSDYIFTDEEVGVWRVVSEDSDHFRARLTVIHCLHDLNDLQQPTWSEMRIRSDDLHTRYESLKVETLRGSQ